MTEQQLAALKRLPDTSANVAAIAAAERKRFAKSGAAARWSGETKSRSKMGNIPVVVEGVGRFHSHGEAERYDDLLFLERAGAISNLRRQVKYELIPRQNDRYGKCLFRAVTWTADFVYIENGNEIVEDFKGFPNDRWPMKKALMYWRHQILIREVAA